MKLQLRTEITTTRQPGLLSHRNPVVLLGSCFSDNIGRRLAQRGFNVTANPLGPVYNPLSLAGQAWLLSSERHVEPSDLFEHEGQWRHFLAHTLLARPTAREAADAINRRLDEVRERITPDTLLCLTLGTAWVYELTDDVGPFPMGTSVSNCHKMPASCFSRRLLTPEEAFGAIVTVISLLSPARAIVTVSPVRHLADGLDGNSLSKATLRLAADLTEKNGDAIYFPAYEAVTDDLRDYRFYNPDMTHPTEQAADYVYDLFEDTFADANTRARSAEALREYRRNAHRPLLATPPADPNPHTR